ncbi:uncharacterized protein N7496_011682 [Penicillium cataractarum]|uniref:Uncharacterized protein n=1 Tax=Penicillium cataractarum TaxID=2100454 RepID=A0A9W9RI52_9EURO|nr:uncharacterized protein N7496_011682 [Penicillium cataractarum]KAJ5359269.1 hypothetical protein N7496_011682 [Penicillium cataractarum]
MAAKAGDESLVTRLLKTDLYGPLYDDLVWIAISAATVQGHVSIVKLLVEDPSTPKYESVIYGTNALHLAVEYGQETILRYLLYSKKVDFDKVDDDGWSLICLAIFHGNKSILKVLLTEVSQREVPYAQRGLTLQKMHNGVPPLHLAAAIGDLSMVEMLLGSAGKHFRLLDLYKNTPLHLAAAGSLSYMIETLSITDPSLRSKYAGMPANFVTIPQHFEVVQLLASRLFPWLNAENREGNTALHLAAQFGHLKVVQLLAHDPGVNLNATNNVGKTPLNLAIEYERYDIVVYLLRVSTDDIAARASVYNQVREAQASKGNANYGASIREEKCDNFGDNEGIEGRGDQR